MSLVMYTGDLKPDLEVTCTADDPVDLTDATSVRIIGKRGDTIVFDRTPTLAVVGDTTVAGMLWQPGDTTDIGRIQVEVEATWPGNKKQTFRADGGVDVRKDFDAENLPPVDPPDPQSVVSDASINAVLVVPGGAARQTVADMVEDAVASLVPGTELAFAERTSNYTNTQVVAGAAALIPSMAFNIVGTGRPVDIEVNAPNCRHSVANTGMTFYITVDGNVTDPKAASGTVSSPVTTGSGRNICFRRRIILDDGVTYAFALGVFGAAAGTNNVNCAAYAPLTFTATSR